MRQISELFEHNDIRSSINDGYRERREYYQIRKDESYRPDIARFKMQIYFKDGNKRYFYSYDDRPNGTKDEWYGLSALIYQAVEWEEQGKIKTISIYANLKDEPRTKDKSYDCLVWRFWKDRRNVSRKKENPQIGFRKVGKKIILKIKAPIDQ